MNITKELGEELGEVFSKKLREIPEIQIFANHFIFKYQWRDLRYKKTSDTFKNKNYNTRFELKMAMKRYLNKQ